MKYKLNPGDIVRVLKVSQALTEHPINQSKLDQINTISFIIKCLNEDTDDDLITRGYLYLVACEPNNLNSSSGNFYKEEELELIYAQ